MAFVFSPSMSFEEASSQDMTSSSYQLMVADERNLFNLSSSKAHQISALFLMRIRHFGVKSGEVNRIRKAFIGEPEFVENAERILNVASCFLDAAPDSLVVKDIRPWMIASLKTLAKRAIRSRGGHTDEIVEMMKEPGFGIF